MMTISIHEVFGLDFEDMYQCMSGLCRRQLPLNTEEHFWSILYRMNWIYSERVVL